MSRAWTASRLGSAGSLQAPTIKNIPNGIGSQEGRFLIDLFDQFRSNVALEGAALLGHRTGERSRHRQRPCADVVQFDADLGRIYVGCSSGAISVFQEDDPDHFRKLERFPAEPTRGGKPVEMARQWEKVSLRTVARAISES
jgi:hypothetical protein